MLKGRWAVIVHRPSENIEYHFPNYKNYEVEYKGLRWIFLKMWEELTYIDNRVILPTVPHFFLKSKGKRHSI